MKKRTIILETNELGIATAIIPLKGFLEKVSIKHSEKQKFDNLCVIKIESDENDLVLQLSGNKSETYYPRTEINNKASSIYTFDGSNPQTTRNYINEFLRVSVESAGKNTKLDSLTFYFE